MTTREMDRYEKRAREIIDELNNAVTAGKLISGSTEYSERMWLIDTLLKASKTYKKAA